MAKQFNLVKPNGQKEPVKLKTMTPAEFVNRKKAKAKKSVDKTKPSTGTTDVK